MKYIFQIFYLLFTILFFQSCNSLSKTQINLCNQYYKNLQIICNATTTAIEQNKNNADKIQQFYIASLTNDSLIIDSLKNFCEQYPLFFQQNQLLSYATNNLQNYIANYTFQATINTNFLSSFKNFTSYIPFGIGEIVYEIIYQTRNIIIKPNIGKKIRKHLKNGTIPISTFVLQWQQQADLLIKENKQLKNQFNKNYFVFIKNLKEKPDSYLYYSRYNKIYINIYQQNRIIKTLLTEITTATKYMNYSHEQLLQQTKNKHKIKNLPPEIDSLFFKINLIKDLETKLKKIEE